METKEYNIVLKSGAKATVRFHGEPNKELLKEAAVRFIESVLNKGGTDELLEVEND